MIDRNHPAVTRCFPGGEVTDRHIIMAESFAEVIREALPHLTADDLRHTPAGRQLQAEAWTRCADHPALKATGLSGTLHHPTPYRKENRDD